MDSKYLNSQSDNRCHGQTSHYHPHVVEGHDKPTETTTIDG